MRMCLVAGVLLCGLPSVRCISAQGADPNLMREAEAVRLVVAENKAALRQYTWTEHTEVLVKGEIKSSSDLICRYDASGEVTRTPKGEAAATKGPSAVSKRPIVRKKAAMQDYIERAISLIHNYVPPNPDRIQAMLQNGSASMGQSEAGKHEIRFQRYFRNGDSLVFRYDPVSKVLLSATIASTLGDKKDPVTLDAVFETLPDGVNHLASTTLNAKTKNVQVRTSNVMYQKVSN